MFESSQDSQYFWWYLFVQSLTAFLAIPAETPLAGLFPMKGHSDLSCQFVSSFITFNTPVTWHPYQLNAVLFSQFHEELIAVPNQF
jgi:hypothetical protein